MTDSGSRIARGAVAGALATLCMSTVPWVSKRLGFVKDFPERQLTRQLLKLKGEARPGKRKVRLLTDVMQTSIGTTAGAAFAMLPKTGGSRVWEGMWFGLGIWLVGYRGIIPALGLESRKVGERSRGLKMTNLAAHLIYGAVLGAGLEKLEHLQKGRRENKLEPTVGLIR